MAGVYQAFVVDIDGSVFGELVNATIGPVVTELNGIGSCDVTLATSDTDATLLQPGRELMIKRDGTVIWWGPIVRPKIGVLTSTWQAQGLLWYFSRRYMGRADRTNLLTNGDFEASEASWTFNGVTHAVETGTVFEGTKSEKLTGGAADHTTYATQTYTHVLQSHPLGDYLTGSAWVYVPSSGYSGGAVADRGLFVIRRNSAGITIAATAAIINDATPKNTWIQLEAGVPGVSTGDTVEVRLYPPHGIAYYDLVTLTAMESLALGDEATGAFLDAAEVAGHIVEYAQDNYTFTHGKSDLNIGIDTPDCGTGIVRVYQFVEHRNILDAIQELVSLALFDMHVEIDATTRTFTTYAPRKGSYQAGEALTLTGVDANVADFTWSWDGQGATTSVILAGPGDGPDRPEGAAVDTAALGGLTLETVETAADSVRVADLDRVAAEILRVRSKPEIVEVTTFPAGSAITGLEVGDTIDLDLVYGASTVSGRYRVVKISLNPNTDQATFTMNPDT